MERWWGWDCLKVKPVAYTKFSSGNMRTWKIWNILYIPKLSGELRNEKIIFCVLYTAAVNKFQSTAQNLRCL